MTLSGNQQNAISGYREYKLMPVPLASIELADICNGYGADNSPVTWWVPRREEIQRIIEAAKAVHTGEGLPRILEVGAGTGFLSLLLARTGQANVLATDPNKSLVEIASEFYFHPNLYFEVGLASEIAERYANSGIDVVVNSWMPNGINLTPNIREINAKAIIYSMHCGEDGYSSTGVSQFDMYGKENLVPVPEGRNREDYLSFEPGNIYKNAFFWKGPTRAEIIELILEERTPLSENNANMVIVQLRKDIPALDIPKLLIRPEEKYSWEALLERLKGSLEEVQRF